jgi:hypothetical protein
LSFPSPEPLPRPEHCLPGVHPSTQHPGGLSPEPPPRPSLGLLCRLLSLSAGVGRARSLGGHYGGVHRAVRVAVIPAMFVSEFCTPYTNAPTLTVAAVK